MPYAECPNFNKCNCNKCPLDPGIEERIKLPDDEKCRAEKSTRMRIGAKYPQLLKYQGLTKKEWTMRKIWDEKTYQEKILISTSLSKMRKSALKRHFSGGSMTCFPGLPKKGGTNVSVKKRV